MFLLLPLPRRVSLFSLIHLLLLTVTNHHSLLFFLNFFFVGFLNKFVHGMASELEEVPFSYTGQMGPANWGKLHPQFQECVVGKSQSPVDIITNKTELNPNLKPLSRNYRPGKSTLVNNGFNVGVCTSSFLSFFFSPFYSHFFLYSYNG